MAPLPNYMFGDQTAVHHQYQQQQQQKRQEQQNTQQIAHHKQIVSSLGVDSAPEESSTASSEASGEPGERRESSASAGAAPAFTFTGPVGSVTAVSQSLGMSGSPGLAGVSLPTMHGSLITPEYLSLIQREDFLPVLSHSLFSSSVAWEGADEFAVCLVGIDREQTSSSSSWLSLRLRLKPLASTEVRTCGLVRVLEESFDWSVAMDAFAAFAAALGQPFLGGPNSLPKGTTTGLEFFS
jgi:hypothetical protein